MSVRTGSEAVAWAVGQHRRPQQDWTGLCLRFVRMCFDVGPMQNAVPAGGSAAIAWDRARSRHRGANPPVATPVFWDGGSKGFGHVALSAGGGFVWSSDAKRTGRVDKVSIASITKGWRMTYLGWTEDINGVRVYDDSDAPAALAAPPRVRLDHIVEAFSKDRHRPQGDGLHEADVRPVERALKREGLLDTRHSKDGYAGTLAVAGYARWQQRSGVGGAFDGIPGVASLTRLGKRHGFVVVG